MHNEHSRKIIPGTNAEHSSEIAVCKFSLTCAERGIIELHI
jgi:hypothetical protein